VTPPLPFAGTYPQDANFWVPPAETAVYPWRYGDLVATPADAGRHQTVDSKGRPWRALMLTHPSCELGAKGAPNGVQAVRVYWLREVGQRQGAEIMAGFTEVDGLTRVARAHQVYLAPVPGHAKLEERMYADLRQSVRIPDEDLRTAGRVGAASHDARLSILRRDVYFRYRWALGMKDVLALERSRIEADTNFAGPLPQWVAGADPGTSPHEAR
jgi:hypothetical protein